MNPDFYEMLSAFNATHVEYLVVGAYAMKPMKRSILEGATDVF